MALKIKGKQGRKCLLPAAPATPCCIPGLMRSVCATAKHQLSKSQSVSHNWGFHLQPLLSTVNASAAGRGAGMGAGAVPLEGVYSDSVPFLRFAFSKLNLGPGYRCCSLGVTLATLDVPQAGNWEYLGEILTAVLPTRTSSACGTWLGGFCHPGESRGSKRPRKHQSS